MARCEWCTFEQVDTLQPQLDDRNNNRHAASRALLLITLTPSPACNGDIGQNALVAIRSHSSHSPLQTVYHSTITPSRTATASYRITSHHVPPPPSICPPQLSTTCTTATLCFIQLSTTHISTW